MIVSFVFLILIVVAGWAITTRNRFVRYDKQVQNAASSIDVFYKKRYDLIPNLVAAAGKYMEYEISALKKLTGIRADAERKSIVAADKEVSGAIYDFLAVAEQYPQLKADEQFHTVTEALREVENELSAARRAYNSSATAFNTLICLFPNSLIAGHYREYDLFTAASQERRNVTMDFNVPE